MIQAAFYFLSILAIFSALMVVFSRNPVHSVLYLVITFFAITGHYALLNAQFLAIVNFIVYAGAIMVLFLFVVMLLNLNKESEPRQSSLLKVAAALCGGLLLLLTVAGVVKGKADAVGVAEAALYPETKVGFVKEIGMSLFTEYLIPFEVVSILFLSAMVGAVVLGRKD